MGRRVSIERNFVYHEESAGRGGGSVTTLSRHEGYSDGMIELVNLLFWGMQIMATRRLPRDEIGKRGSEIYEQHLRPTLLTSALDQFVAIDVETAEYEVADEAHLAGDRLRKRLPNAQVFIARVGHRAAFIAR